jgi:hypothetical protein
MIASLLVTALPLQGAARSSVLAAPEPSDLARSVVDAMRWTQIDALETEGAHERALALRPWSGWYWPFQTAGIAFRYADPTFPRGASWSVVQSCLQRTRIMTRTEQLSPAEKYYLLVGDPNWSLTEANLRLAQQQAAGDRIAPWKGL